MMVIDLLMNVADDQLITLTEDGAQVPDFSGVWADIQDVLQYEACTVTNKIRFENGFLHIVFYRFKR